MHPRFLTARTIAGLTLRQAAAKLGWSYNRARDVECGDTKPTDAEVASMATLFCCRLAWLIGEISSPEAILARHGLTMEKIEKMAAVDRERFLEALDAVEFEEKMVEQKPKA